MSSPPGTRLRYEVRLPRDPMTADRLRHAARRLYLAGRAGLLLSAGLLRRRERRPPSPSAVARLLVVRTDRVGDMVLTTAALTDLREHFRQAEITRLAPPGPLELLRAHPAVDRLVPLSAAGLPRDLVGRFDLAIDFTSDESLRGALLVKRSRARWRAGLRGAGREVFFNLSGPRADQARHVADLGRDLAAFLGAAPRAAAPVLYVTNEEKGEAQARLAALGAGVPRVAIHPGGFYPSQRWSPERFAELISALTGRTGAACVVLAGPGEEDLARRIGAATTDALQAGPLTLRSLMAMIACCDLFIGNNSGPLHIAGALGVPTVSLMGPTDPRRFAPRGPADRVLRRPLPCSPCRRGHCWHHTCLRAVEPGEALAEAEAALAALLPQEEAR
ncbi:MAG TPA: glycosyltransferase family 9 protein [Candidatus Polarisedimenticolia bacterium]|nr:glycosyltransferase family 9 protein [Candidatus Polarisedimenticolia bacterium]